MIFDTDVLIWATRGNARAAAWIDADAERAVSIVTVMELLQGARSKAEMKILRQAFHAIGFRVYPLTEAVSGSAMGLVEEYALSTGLQVADALIAATAIAAGETLVTTNEKHFRAIRNLTLKTFRVS